MKKSLWVLLAAGGMLAYTTTGDSTFDQKSAQPAQLVAAVSESGLEVVSGPPVVPTVEPAERLSIIPEIVGLDREAWAGSVLDEMTADLRDAEADMQEAYVTLRRRQVGLMSARRELDWVATQHDAIEAELERTLDQLAALRAQNSTDPAVVAEITALQNGLSRGLRPALQAARRTLNESVEVHDAAQQAVVEAHNWVNECRIAVSDSRLAVEIANQQIDYLEDGLTVAASNIGT